MVLTKKAVKTQHAYLRIHVVRNVINKAKRAITPKSIVNVRLVAPVACC